MLQQYKILGTQIVAGIWNALFEEVVAADTLTIFKKYQGKYLNYHSIEGFGIMRANRISTVGTLIAAAMVD